MTEFPPGKWSILLIGEQWPSDGEILVLAQGRAKREALGCSLGHFADLLEAAQTQRLAEQRGVTVEDLRQAFRRGEAHARTVSEKNAVKARAYEVAHGSMVSLQHDLMTLAEESNNAIEKIESSNESEAAKISKIIAAINRCKALASLAAAKYSANVVDAIQRVLDADTSGQSARRFVENEGVDVGRLFRPRESQEDLENQVRSTLSKSSAPTSVPLNAATSGPSHALDSHPIRRDDSLVPINLSTTPTSCPRETSVPQHSAGSALPSNFRTSPSPGSAARAGTLPPATTPPLANAGTGRSMPQPAASAPAPVLPSTPAMPGHMAGAPAPPFSLAASVTPSELVQSFNKGLESSAPISATGHAISHASLATPEPVSHATPTNPAAVVNAPVHAPSVETPPPVHHPPAPESSQPATIVAATPPMVPAAAPTPVGPLPSYGSDLRPPVSTTVTPPTPPNSLPVSATPGSAPVSPAAGHSSGTQPSLVRQAPSSPPPPPQSSGMATQAVAATASGAAMGTASAEATARARLQRLVDAVAHQQPRLAWAAGDRSDQTTVLATDLASGWIPPDIDLPAAVTLLEPNRRRGGLEALLGEVTVAASYTPVHQLPADGEPIAISSRPRRAPGIDELGWELCQAAQWRDGLPRLAHTLAKAASAGTGVLDSEVGLLREHLAAVGARVLDGYPNDVDSHDVQNWQLLAAIDSLIAGDKAAANYHLAWFLAMKADR